jgi:hypothetical protein
MPHATVVFYVSAKSLKNLEKNNLRGNVRIGCIFFKIINEHALCKGFSDAIRRQLSSLQDAHRILERATIHMMKFRR